VRRRKSALVLLAILLAGSSCAYYNTFYLARKNYYLATGGEPYPIDPASQSRPQLTTSINYSKKVLTQYSSSKWVDDAYVLWACALLGQDDPLKTVSMLEDFPLRFPNSPIRNDAVFYLGVGYRKARKYRNAVRSFDQFLAEAPKGTLAPYAHYERANALVALKEPAEAARSASHVLDDFPKSTLVDRARIVRADALFEAREFEASRRDYRYLGDRSRTDDERLRFLLREADCLEAAGRHDQALELLEDAISYERPPARTDTTGGRVAQVQPSPGYDHYGQLLLRIGTVHLQAGQLEPALEAYQRVFEDYPRDKLSHEAQYRIAYAWETVGDDFERARVEYQTARNIGGQSGFGAQADERLKNLERLARFRGAGQDSAELAVEADFLLAEQYLFQLDKPDRAIEQYQQIAANYAGTASAGKALNAQAWVLSRRMDRPAEADTLFWRVVREYPATEAQLAARDYLELAGYEVPADLIRLPEPPVVAADTTVELTMPPEETPRLGELPAGADSLNQLGRPPAPPGIAPAPAGPMQMEEAGATTVPSIGVVDSSRTPTADSVGTRPTPPDSLAAPKPPRPAKPDTSRIEK
jgi:tetratricopeptide (TPR) repeat protein